MARSLLALAVPNQLEINQAKSVKKTSLVLPTPAGPNGHFFKDGNFGCSVIFIGWPIKNKDKVIYVLC